jgi:hypothetical protein
MPTINGILLREADHLIARDAMEGDENYLGSRIQPGRKVVVSRKNCETIGGEADPTTAEPIPQVHAESDYWAYGQWRHQRNRDDGRWIDGEKYTEYYTCPVYYIRGSQVYQGSIYSSTDPRLEAIRSAEEAGEATENTASEGPASESARQPA